MKKIAAALIMLSLMFVGGCGLSTPEGFSQVKKAREIYEDLDSATLTMTDMSDGQTLMEFSFYIRSNNEMVFSYISEDESGIEGAYSDGAQFFYKNRTDENWTLIPTSDESYLYNLYSKTYRYPYARGSVFFLDGTSVSSASITENSDGSAVVEYIYDPEKLNENSVELLEGVSSFSSLTIVYEIAADGCMKSFTEKGTITDENGEQQDIHIKMSVSDANAVSDIQNPVDKTAENQTEM